MEQKLRNEPDFDFDAFRAKLSEWKAAGAKDVGIDWSTGAGPTVAYYPLTDQSLGAAWSVAVAPARYSEAYADFIEDHLVRRLTEIVRALDLAARIRCVDQQPILVQRQRRREIESAQHVH